MIYRMILAVVCCALVCLSTATAQSGRWVEHDLADYGNGMAEYDRGDDCLIFTRNLSRYVAIFDVEVGEWLKVDVGSGKDFSFAMTDGEVAFAGSSDFLFAYSAELETWDTITYTGTLLNWDYSSPTRSYDCSGKLAGFVSDEAMYIFEADVGQWKAYPYTLPPDYLTCKYYVKDDYCVLQLNRSTSLAMPMNVVYSTYTRAFNHIEDGMSVRVPMDDHGFFGVLPVDPSAVDHRFVGYSAYTNTFATQQRDATDEDPGSSFWPDDNIAHEFTTALVSYRKVTVPFVSIAVDLFGFDTRHGNWVNLPWVFYMADETYAGGGKTGGTFAVTTSTLTDDNSLRYFFFSGTDNIWRDEHPGLVYKSGQYGWKAGGNFLLAFDSLRGWGYNVDDGLGNITPLAGYHGANIEVGCNWGTFSRYWTDRDTMVIYFYNSATNSWKTTEAAKETFASFTVSPEMLIYQDRDWDQVIVYSGTNHELIKIPVPDGVFATKRIRWPMAMVKDDAHTYAINEPGLSVNGLNVDLTSVTTGTHSLVGYDATTPTLYGYSILDDSWTSLDIGGAVNFVADTGYIGVVATAFYNEVYAFNGFHPGFVELDPVGTGVTVLAGTKTALVYRHTPYMLYAFDPEGVVLDAEDDSQESDILPHRFALHQNYPNPFNPTTVISYELPRRCDVHLSIYNILGQEVRTLVDEEMPAGEHEVEWNAADASGHQVASGVYMYRLTADEFVSEHKMVLVR